jgi:hypothetical protein
VEVHKVSDKESYDKILKDSCQFRKFADIRENLEETLFRAGELLSENIEKTIKIYEKALQSTSMAITSTETEINQQKDFMRRIHGNLAVCFNSKSS